MNQTGTNDLPRNKFSQRALFVYCSAVIVLLFALGVATLKYILPGMGENQVTAECKRRERALGVLARSLNLAGSLDETVEALEKFQNDSATLDVGSTILKNTLAATAAESGITPLEISRAKNSVVILLPDDLLFDRNTNKVAAPAKVILKEISDAIEPFGDEFTLTVTGHTSTSSVSQKKLHSEDDAADAWILSASRAAMVVSELIKFGVNPIRVTARGVADTQTLFPGTLAAGSLNQDTPRKNRRTEIEITSGKKSPAVPR